MWWMALGGTRANADLDPAPVIRDTFGARWAIVPLADRDLVAGLRASSNAVERARQGKLVLFEVKPDVTPAD